MNIQEYKSLVCEFFTLIFGHKYSKVSIPFVISISLFTFMTTTSCYLIKIKKLRKKYLLNNLIMYRDSNNNLDVPNVDTNMVSVQNNVQSVIVPSAPPQTQNIV